MEVQQKEYEFCKRCHRKLKTKESRIIGYGPTCLKKKERSTKVHLFPKK